MKYWERDGHTCTVLCGTKKYIPADLLFLHIDLSVVPKKYLKFSKKYPVVINGEVQDIRKSVCSQAVLGHDTDYSGPVIVKSTLNYYGLPELKRSRNRISRWFMRKRIFLEYEIYDDYKKVPKDIVNNSNLVIEKFLPETDGENYYIRHYTFLGDCESWTRRTSKHPLIKAKNTIEIKQVSPNPKIIELRKKMKFDYGKFDYLVYNGEPILIDVNKTIGAGSTHKSMKKGLVSPAEYLASGISTFINNKEI